MAEPGPKEAAQRANGDANRKRKLIPYAGKPKGQEGVESLYLNRASAKPKDPDAPKKPPRKRRKLHRKIA